ncbi:hypothetical protein KCP78_21585 [Salmonella enterica subsp. enterica]|nr:hypothetical protein KCP78_21585 [Salmonella enterica subsp. enterica]
MTSAGTVTRKWGRSPPFGTVAFHAAIALPNSSTPSMARFGRIDNDRQRR